MIYLYNTTDNVTEEIGKIVFEIISTIFQMIIHVLLIFLDNLLYFYPFIILLLVLHPVSIILGKYDKIDVKSILCCNHCLTEYVKQDIYCYLCGNKLEN